MKLLVWVALVPKDNKLNLNGPVNIYQKLLGQRNIFPNLDSPGCNLLRTCQNSIAYSFPNFYAWHILATSMSPFPDLCAGPHIWPSSFSCPTQAQKQKQNFCLSHHTGFEPVPRELLTSPSSLGLSHLHCSLAL